MVNEALYFLVIYDQLKTQQVFLNQRQLELLHQNHAFITGFILVSMSVLPLNWVSAYYQDIL